MEIVGAPEGLGREVLVEVVDDHIAIITLNRPEKRNAINRAVGDALSFLVKATEADPGIRVVVLGSSSEIAFCAGADLSEIDARNRQGFVDFIDAPRTKPWIAAVTGYAMAGGCELCLACDMIVASAESRFGLSEPKRGLIAGGGGVHRLARVLPRNVALELIATGDPFSAERAYELGMVNRLAATGAVMEVAVELAKVVASNAPVSVRESLRIARQAQEVTDVEMRKWSEAAVDLVLATTDAKEGPRAFLEKRTPRWEGC